MEVIKHSEGVVNIELRLPFDITMVSASELKITTRTKKATEFCKKLTKLCDKYKYQVRFAPIERKKQQGLTDSERQIIRQAKILQILHPHKSLRDCVYQAVNELADIRELQSVYTLYDITLDDYVDSITKIILNGGGTQPY